MASLVLLASIYGLYLLAVMLPGPNTFIVMRLALGASRGPAWRAVLGIATGNALWLAAILGGVAVLLQESPGVMRGVHYGGGLYLLLLGVRSLRALRGGATGEAPGGTAAPGREAGEAERPARSGLLASLTNPNTLPFYLSILAPALAPGTPEWVRLAAAAGIVAIAMGWYGGLAWGLSTGHVRRAYLRRAPLIRAALALVLVGYGVRLLVSG